MRGAKVVGDVVRDENMDHTYKDLLASVGSLGLFFVGVVIGGTVSLQRRCIKP